MCSALGILWATMGDLESVGEAVTGGLLASAVEPRAGGTGARDHTHEKHCLNCGAMLTGTYCAACGQKAHVHRSVRGFFQDFVHGLFNFEGKIWRTLPMLAWRPGEMTRRYIAGERARFISPVALYLFTVFAMFAVLNLTGSLHSGGRQKTQAQIERRIAGERAALAAMETQRKTAGGATGAALDQAIAKQKADIANFRNVSGGRQTTWVQTDKDAPNWVRQLAQSVGNDPNAASSKIQNAASKFSWLLIPISVPFLWLLFPFSRRYNIYDHAVFVTYSLSFMMMLAIAGGVLVAIGVSSLAGLLFFVPPFHMFRQLKGAYVLTAMGALWRTVLLTFFGLLASSLFLGLMVVIGLFD
jgi:hypothetical protein